MEFHPTPVEPTSTPAQAAPAAAPARRSLLLPILVTAVFAAGLTFGGLYAWEQYMATSEPAPVAPQTNNTQIETYRTEIAELKDQLFFEKFKVAIFGAGIRADKYARDPKNANKFYYIMPSGTDHVIFEYDSTKDTDYKTDGTINIYETQKQIYGEALPPEQELRVAGIIDTNLVFYSTLKEDSPGPCSHPLLSNYSFVAIDLSAATKEKKPYTIPANVLAEKKAISDACIKTLN